MKHPSTAAGKGRQAKAPEPPGSCLGESQTLVAVPLHGLTQKVPEAGASGLGASTKKHAVETKFSQTEAVPSASEPRNDL